MTADATFFDSTDAVTADVLLASSDVHSSSISSAQLDRAHDDLSSFKRRIDANTEEQREHADVMASLQRKVRFFLSRF